MASVPRAAAAATAIALVLTGLAASPAAAADPRETLAVDFSQRTGEFRGGATGTLYGFGDDGSPTQALIDGARITNTSQKPPGGAQHPSGDSAKIERSFAAKHGEDLIIYMQDFYPDWAYNGGRRPGDDRTYAADGTWTAGGNGVWDYEEVMRIVLNRVADTADDPSEYVFKPYNEPNGGNWYPNWGAQREQFLADWSTAYELIHEVWAERGLGDPRVAGTGDSHWDAVRTRDFFAYATPRDEVPDVFIWHELGIDNLANFRRHYDEYRAIEREFGVEPLDININEYGMLRDMGVPGQLIQWFSLFEGTKVNAQTAYWNYAGNFSDNSARANGANGGWWMFKWYGDLAGSETVRVTPPQLDVVDTLQGIGAIDTDDRRASVLFGGTDADVDLALSGLDAATFGTAVDVEVREVALSGAQGLTGTPRVIHAESDVAVVNGAVTLPVDVYDRYAAYQLIITPAGERDVEADAAAQTWESTIEAEDTRITGATAYDQDPRQGGGWKFLASGGRDVGGFNTAASKLEWTVEVPRDGTYRFQSIGGANGVAGKHALFVGDRDAATLEYTAGLTLRPHHDWQYRGSAEVEVQLKAGTNVLSVRASRDGSTRLPGSDITLDRLVLTEVTQGEPTVYPASTFRLYGAATLDHAAAAPATGSARLSGDDRADLYVSAMRNGYQDVRIRWTAAAAGTVGVTVNGNAVGEVAAESAGTWDSTLRVRLAEGINEIELRSPGGAHIASVTTTAARDADAAAITVEAESARTTGTARVQTETAGSNASQGRSVGYLGRGAGNALEIDRRAGFDTAGNYDLEIVYANAELQGNHAYNPQVVDRRLDVRESGAVVGSTHFRYTIGWDSFWTRTVPVTLATGNAPIVLGNPDAYAPNIDRVTIAPRTVGEPTSVRVDAQPALTIDAAVSTRCVLKRAVLSVTAANTNDVPVAVRIQTAFGERSFAAVAPAKYAFHAFTTRQVDLSAGTVTVTATAQIDGKPVEVSEQLAHDARSCR